MAARILFLLAALAAALPAGAQDLGTLFFTPREREALDRLRRGETPAAQAAQPAPRPEPVVTGYVKRSDGRSTVFIDKRPYPVHAPDKQRLLRPDLIESFEPLALPPEPEPPLPAPATGTSEAKPAGPASPTAAPAKAPAPPARPAAAEKDD